MVLRICKLMIGSSFSFMLYCMLMRGMQIVWVLFGPVCFFQVTCFLWWNEGFQDDGLECGAAWVFHFLMGCLGGHLGWIVEV